ncbi:MAG: TetR/AcrR family transcriptional regulator [Ancrocorticia sp.]|uniref:TetR/AcrR family transcriptional regulator n=1 Tax=Ancrocorticia sp. TaxID=2593684 RepID=UPI003F93336E
MGRRELVLDAGIDVVADKRMRGLTHRAVDQYAGLPAGATSNMYRTRARLIYGIVERILERELDVWSSLATPTADAESLSDALAVLVSELTTTHRDLTVARYAIVTEAAIDTDTLQIFAAGRNLAIGWAEEQLTKLGSPNAGPESRILLALFDGLLTEALTASNPPLDTRRAFRVMLSGLLPGSSE